MKLPIIAHLTKYYPPARGGIESHLETLCNRINKDKFKLKVICVNHRNDKMQSVEYKAFCATKRYDEFTSKLHVYRMGRLFNFSRFDFVPEFWSYNSMRALLKDTNLIHLHCPNPSITIPLSSYHNKIHVPIIITHHSDIIKQKALKPIVNYFDEKLYAVAKKVVVSNIEIARSSVFLKKYLAKVVEIPFGIELFDRVSEIPNQNDVIVKKIIESSIIWLMVGRHVYYKGHLLAIDALPSLPGLLVIVGSGPLTEELQKKAVSLKIQNRIVWIKDVSPSMLTWLYSKATALLFPSTHKSESFGIVQIEAMAQGCPVINTNIPGSGVPYVSLDDISGITIEPTNIQALTDACIRISLDLELRQKYAIGAKKRAQQMFSATLMAQRYEQLYSSLL